MGDSEGMVKSFSFWQRLGFALNGIKVTFCYEINFKIQLTFAMGAISALVFFRAATLWWAIFFVVIAGVLSLEVLNTAVESLADALHPNPHPLVGRAKDCAAGAVLIWSLVSLAVFAVFLYEHCFSF